MGNCVSCLKCFTATTAESPLFDDVAFRRTLTPIESNPAFQDARLCDVVIYSSHNSYIRTFQVGSTSSTDALNIALQRGARCLELDVFREPSAQWQVFVAHGQQKPDGNDLLGTSKLPLKDALTFLASNAWTNTSDPLFVALEINVHNNTIACDAIANMIINAFAPEQLLPPGQKITPTTRIQSLCNKVVFISGGGVSPLSKLNNYINAVWSTEFQNTHHMDTQETLRFTQGVVRIYPLGDVKGTLSLNYDPLPFLQKGATFVSMNVCTNDKHMVSYDNYFGNASILLSDPVKNTHP